MTAVDNLLRGNLKVPWEHQAGGFGNTLEQVSFKRNGKNESESARQRKEKAQERKVYRQNIQESFEEKGFSRKRTVQLQRP